MSEEVQEIHDALNELVDILRRILSKWREYQDILDSGVNLTDTAYHVPVVLSGRPGRPSFDVSREQLEYLSSLQFTWSEIVALHNQLYTGEPPNANPKPKPKPKPNPNARLALDNV